MDLELVFISGDIMKKLFIIGFLSLFAMALLGFTKVLNAPHIMETEGASYSDVSAVIYVVAGLMLIFIAFFTYKLHFIAGIIPFLLGVSCLLYGLFICFVKFG